MLNTTRGLLESALTTQRSPGCLDLVDYHDGFREQLIEFWSRCKLSSLVCKRVIVDESHTQSYSLSTLIGTSHNCANWLGYKCRELSGPPLADTV